jgi:hypothetical protein
MPTLDCHVFCLAPGHELLKFFKIRFTIRSSSRSRRLPSIASRVKKPCLYRPCAAPDRDRQPGGNLQRPLGSAGSLQRPPERVLALQHFGAFMG